MMGSRGDKGVPVLKPIVNQSINPSMAVPGSREDRGIPVLKTIVNQSINPSMAVPGSSAESLLQFPFPSLPHPPKKIFNFPLIKL